MAKNQVPRVEISDAQWRDIRRLWNTPNNKTTKEIVAELQLPFAASSLGTKMRERGMEPNQRRAHMGLSKLSLPAANRQTRRADTLRRRSAGLSRATSQSSGTSTGIFDQAHN